MFRFTIVPAVFRRMTLAHLAGLTLWPAVPLASGTFTYTAPSITLSASTYYFVTVTSETPVLQGSYNWSAANSFTSDNAWEIDDVYFSSPDGSTWTGYGRQNVFQMAIYATAIPEPGNTDLGRVGAGRFELPAAQTMISNHLTTSLLPRHVIVCLPQRGAMSGFRNKQLHAQPDVTDTKTDTKGVKKGIVGLSRLHLSTQ